MAVQKPSKPDVTLPDNFGGTKTPYTASQISNGYQEAVPQVVDGGNINYEKDGIFKYLKYLKTAIDALVDMPIGKVLTVDSNNRFEYANPTVIANDSEYEEGALTTKSPSVKQVRDSLSDLDGRITNCITAIPNDINLELNNGTLTLKAGSRVYNGDGTFYTNSSDVSLTPSWGTVSGLFVFPTTRGSSIVGFDAVSPSLVFSGDTAPTFSGNYAYWFDTTVKKVKYTNNGGSSWSENRAFPLCLATSSNDMVTSIDQVFNGFVYIGNVTRILPGVECLRTYGRNADGSLNSLKTTITQVVAPDLDTDRSRIEYYINGDNSAVAIGKRKYIYDNTNNVYINNPDGSYHYICFAYSVTKDSTGRITSLNPNPVFQAQDYYSAARVDDDNVFTGNNTFSGTVNFEKGIYFNSAVSFVKNTTNTSDEYNDINYVRDNALVVGNIPHNKTYYTNALMDKNNKYVTYIQSKHTNNGESIIGINARTVGENDFNVTSSLRTVARKDGTTVAFAPTPLPESESDEIATTAWVRQFAVSIDWSQKIDISSVNFVTTGYTAPADGLITANIKPNNYTTLQWAVDGVETGIKWTTGENRDWDSSCTYLPIKKGQKATIIGGDGRNRGTYFTPY